MFDINVKYAQTIKKLDDVFEKGENITKKIEDLIRQEAMIKWRLNDIPINEKEKLNTKMIEIKIKIKKMINQRCLLTYEYNRLKDDEKRLDVYLKMYA